VTKSDIVDRMKNNMPNCKARTTPEIEGVEIGIVMSPPTMHVRKVRMMILP